VLLTREDLRQGAAQDRERKNLRDGQHDAIVALVGVVTDRHPAPSGFDAVSPRADGPDLDD
jgi:hypothetical protein